MTVELAKRRIAVIGGGITGLAAAHRLLELAPQLEVALFEARSRLGGVLETISQDGFLIERSADNFITNVPWALDLCRRVGLADQLLETNVQDRRVFVVHQHQLCEVPSGFVLMAPQRLWPVLATPILSWRGKLRLAAEPVIPASHATDESVASFVQRRLGREAYERLVQPLVGGIYTGDPHQLSMAATLPRFLEMERERGGLLRGARREGSAQAAKTADEAGARYRLFVAPRAGMSSLIAAIAARLPTGTIRLNTSVERLGRSPEGRWQVHLASQTVEAYDGVLIATPAPQAARLLTPHDAQLGSSLAGISHAGSAIVTLGYRRNEIQHPLNGFGFVVPAVEDMKILAGSFASNKFTGRAPEDCVLIRVFVGGALQPQLAELPDDELAQLAHSQLDTLLGIRGKPVLTHISRWSGAMPQYHLGHLDRVRDIEQRAERLPNLELAGNAFHGVGIPACIHSGEEAAERLARFSTRM